MYFVWSSVFQRCSNVKFAFKSEKSLRSVSRFVPVTAINMTDEVDVEALLEAPYNKANDKEVTIE